MKRLYIIIALVLWGCAQMASAQNMYRNYVSTSVRIPTSAVSVVHSNGYVYFFQADDNGHLSATEIDPLSMLPTGNSKRFDINQTPGCIVYLNGGFEDASGDFVLFGYRLQTLNIYSPQNPAYIKITSNFSSCDVNYYINDPGEFTAGCDGFDQVFGEVYMMVNGRELVAVEAAFPNTSHCLELDVVTNPNDYYTDISWDAIHKKFIATGSAWNTQVGYECPFVDVFDLINYTTIHSIAEYFVDNNANYVTANEFKSMHVQLDNNNLILYHDLRHTVGPFAYDLIWLSRINNFWDINTATVVESMFYDLPNHKIYGRDLLYDKINNRLNFLGSFDFNTSLQFLAQANPYSLYTSIDIGQLGIGFYVTNIVSNPQPPYINLYANDFKMSNLALNIHNPCYPVLVAGVGKKTSILTETYDIALSKCDVPMWHEDIPTDPKVKTYSLNITHSLPFVFQPTVIPNPDIINSYYMCDEYEACSHQFGGKSYRKTMTKEENGLEITIESNHLFICDGFEGEIQYFLYDMAGKLLQHGVTRNGERNSLRMSNGLFLLKAYDASGNQIVKKVILL